jgi:hypothetical protein
VRYRAALDCTALFFTELSSLRFLFTALSFHGALFSPIGVQKRAV